MARRRYSNEERAAVMAALLSGQSVSEAAKVYRIPEGTVKAWSADMRRDQPDATIKKAEVGELLLAYLRTNLETLRLQAEAFRDPAWLAKQGASEVAVLHGVLTDKAVRLLEALAGADAGGDAA